MSGPSTVYVVGVGPGDPDLLTIRAARLIECSDLIVHAGPRDDAGMAFRVVAPLLRPEQRVCGMALVMRRGPDDGSVGYERVAELLAVESRAGRTATFLTEGDPMLFGTGSYVAEHLTRLAPEIPIEIIPGISAPSAAAARLAWPLARKDEILTICPATYHAEHIAEIIDRGGTTCWLKAADVLPALVDELRRRGWLDRAVVVERVGCPGERIFRDPAAALGEDLSYFSMVLVQSRKP